MVVRVARSSDNSATGDDNLSGIPYNTYRAYGLAGDLQPDAGRDRVRTWSVITAGALAGVLFVMAGFLVLQLQRRSQELGVIAAQGRAQSALTTGGASNSSAGGLPRQARVGYYPPDFTLSTLEGKSVKLSDLKGKPLWVNFWATWCPPCRAEMPEMKQKYAQFKDKGLVILGVDMSEDPGTVKQFVKGNGYNWTFLLDSGGQVASQYYVTGIPTHLFIGTDGVIKAMQVGGIPSSMMDRYLSQIIQ